MPVRFTYDNNYFNDTYQGIPIGGYTQIFESLLDNIEVKLEIDYLKDREYWNSLANKIIYTGPIDAFYNYQYGELEYKSTKFDHQKVHTDNYQGIAMMNYTDINVPFTRCIEHKHFDYINSEYSYITFEYPQEYIANNTIPYYPVNDVENNKKYLLYKSLNDTNDFIIFGGRLAEYRYYDMDDTIGSALKTCKKELRL